MGLSPVVKDRWIRFLLLNGEACRLKQNHLIETTQKIKEIFTDKLKLDTDNIMEIGNRAKRSKYSLMD